MDPQLRVELATDRCYKEEGCCWWTLGILAALGIISISISSIVIIDGWGKHHNPELWVFMLPLSIAVLAGCIASGRTCYPPLHYWFKYYCCRG